MGLTNKEQAIMMFLSALCLAIAAVSVPADLPSWITLVLGILGAVGMCIKEFAGDAPSPSTDWADFLALSGVANDSPFGTVIETAINPTTKKTWYAVVDKTGHIVLSDIAPS